MGSAFGHRRSHGEHLPNSRLCQRVPPPGITAIWKIISVPNRDHPSTGLIHKAPCGETSLFTPAVGREADAVPGRPHSHPRGGRWRPDAPPAGPASPLWCPTPPYARSARAGWAARVSAPLPRPCTRTSAAVSPGGSPGCRTKGGGRTKGPEHGGLSAPRPSARGPERTTGRWPAPGGDGPPP